MSFLKPSPTRSTSTKDDVASPKLIAMVQDDNYNALKASVSKQLVDRLGPTLYAQQFTEVELAQKVSDTLQNVLSSNGVALDSDRRRLLTEEISNDILGYGPLEPLLRDESVTEIMVNGHDMVYVERAGKLYEAPVAFMDEAHLRRTIDKIVSKIGRRVDEASPMVDARLPDGSRVNAVVPPITLHGSSLTIRKFSTEPYQLADLVNFGTMSAEVGEFLRMCVIGKLNIVVSGSTSSGKTTTLNVMSGFIPENERIVTVEDVAELKLHQRHVVSLESRPANIEGKGTVSIRDLVRNALRMRPDRIVVGEIRDGAALDMLQAMNTGHDGSITTAHSNSPRDTLSRLETMVLMAGMELPVRVIREQIASAVNLIIHQDRLKDGTRRITHITEVVGMEGDVITMQPIYEFDYKAGMDAQGRFVGGLKPTGIRPNFASRLSDMGIVFPHGSFGAI